MTSPRTFRTSAIFAPQKQNPPGEPAGSQLDQHEVIHSKSTVPKRESAWFNNDFAARIHRLWIPAARSSGSKKKPPSGVSSRSLSGGLTSTADFRLTPCRAADHVVVDLVAFSQAVQAGLLNSRDMDEHVLAAGVRRDEAVTLRRVEKFHCPARHVALPRNNDCSSRAAIGPSGKQNPPGVNRTSSMRLWRDGHQPTGR